MVKKISISFTLLLLLACSRKATPTVAGTFAPPVNPAMDLDSTAQETPRNIPVVEVPMEELLSGPELVASLAKTPCYGHCPVFEVRIYADGKVEFYGKENVKLTGKYLSKLTPSALQELREKAGALGFFQFASRYPENGKRISDLPNTITYLKSAQAEKTVVNNHSSPLALRKFEAYLEELINRLTYIKVEGD